MRFSNLQLVMALGSVSLGTEIPGASLVNFGGRQPPEEPNSFLNNDLHITLEQVQTRFEPHEERVCYLEEALLR